jgi:hypothetical protein
MPSLASRNRRQQPFFRELISGSFAGTTHLSEHPDSGVTASAFVLRSIYQWPLSPSGSYFPCLPASVLLRRAVLKTRIGRGRYSPASVPSSLASGVLLVLGVRGVPVVPGVLVVLGGGGVPGCSFSPVLRAYPVFSLLGCCRRGKEGINAFA